jgi:integral membrane protein (TIGR00529 family)
MELLFCFGFIILLVRFKIPVGVTLLLTTLLLSVLEFGFATKTILPLWQTLKDLETWKFIGTVALIITFGEVIARAGFTEKLVAALESFLSPRMIARVAPTLIGLLPMPGGAMVSAPIVAELTKANPEISPERKTAANYWWRHVWEPVWPLYQSVILAAAMFEISIWKVATMTLPISVAAIISGTLVVSIPLSRKRNDNIKIWHSLKSLLYCLWPVILIVLASAMLKIDLIIVVIAIFTIFIVFRLTDFKTIWSSFRDEFSWDIAVLFIGSLALMKIIMAGTSATNLIAILRDWHIPIDFVVFALPFLIGLLTGLTSAYVGVGFPIVISLFPLCGGTSSGALVGFAGGLMGILASPVHLCLVLTKDYFGAKFKGIYYILIPAIGLTTALIFLYKYILAWLI